MLYDKRWDQKTKADPLTLEALIAWLEKQPGKNAYCYMDAGHCLASQFNNSIGRKYSNELFLRGPDCFDKTLEKIAVKDPHTFGAALERARAVAGN